MNRKDVHPAKQIAEVCLRSRPSPAGVWTRALFAVFLIIVLGTILVILGLTIAALIWFVIVVALLGAVIRAAFRRGADRNTQ